MCHRNLTCLGGAEMFFASNMMRGNFYYRTEFFADDDMKFEPLLENTDIRCPDSCCKDRKMCMRVTDVLGWNVPFDRWMVLVFGGRSYRHLFHPVTRRLIYHDCENMPKQDFL